MRRVRVIPVLLLHNRQLVKTTQFKNPKYIGDGINALKIFNEKGADEVVVLDIDAFNRKEPDFEFIGKLVSECFMPLAYGGGIHTMDQAQRLFALGIEKVVIGACAISQPSLITNLANQYGSQSVVVSIDIKKDWLKRNRAFTENGKKNTGLDPLTYAKQLKELGAGELIVQSIDREGTGKGYDVTILQEISSAISIPVVALGGANSTNDFLKAIVEGGASAVAAGSMFVFKGPHKAVLISYPSPKELKEKLYSHL